MRPFSTINITISTTISISSIVRQNQEANLETRELPHDSGQLITRSIDSFSVILKININLG